MTPDAPPAPPARLASLDVFRGATVAAMIVVDNAGDWAKTYAPLLHAEWHGWTPTDLVFPFFLFIVGVAITLALGRARDAVPRGQLERAIWRRAAILFLLGLAVNWFPYYTIDWSRARIPGVLQRIAIVYLVSALAYSRLGPRARAALASLLLVGYALVLRLVAAPGALAGDLSPEHNVAFALDRLVLGTHVWRYSPGPGDPEGLLSTLGAIVSCLAGLAAGDWLRSPGPHGRRRRGLLVASAAAMAAGLVFDRLQPINKNLWTPAYVLFTTGAALLLLAILHALVDERPSAPRWARPFTIFGRNAILVFVGIGILGRLLAVIKLADPAAPNGVISLQKWLYGWFYAPHFPDYVASLAWASTHLLIWFVLLAWLDRRRVYLKV